jgi:large subunit ribosomal protein L21e
VEKRIHLRVEHVRKSRCQEDFLRRVKENDVKKAEAKKNGQIISTKRVMPGPNPSRHVKLTKVEYQNPGIFYEIF